MSPGQWHEIPWLPRWAATVLAALSFARASAGSVESLSDADWRQALAFCDRAQLTLVLGEVCGEHLPEWVRRRIEENLAANTQRLARLTAEYSTVADHLGNRGVAHVLLKGFPHAPHFIPDPRLRVQYDLDLLCTEAQVRQARDAIRELGYEPVHSHERFPTDHLPPLVRKTGWEWNGDYFDPDIPSVVELHFRLWDEATERFAVHDVAHFWGRRGRQPLGDKRVAVLAPVDQLGYAALHALRHLLRGDLKPYHVYELAYFLETHHDERALWQEWAALHEPSLRQLEALMYCLAQTWFDCRVPETAAEEIGQLPRPLRRWLEHYWASPLAREFRPSKDELWLHLSLLPRVSDRLHVLRRRLLPLTLPGPVETVFVPTERITPALRWHRRLRYASFVASRVVYHARSLVNVARGAWRWWRLKGDR